MVAHYYCMACGLLLPHNARSPTASNRLKCPHCQCEMELPSLPSPNSRPVLSPSTPGGGSNSSVYSYVDGHTELDGVKDMRRLRLTSISAVTDGLASPEQSRSGTKVMEEEADQSGDEAEEGGEDSQNNSRNSAGRRSKSKKKRDPLAPKRAANAYMLFCKEQRPLLKIREPDLHFSVIGQRLGDMWRTLPVEEKKPYEDAAADDRDRYKTAMHQYTTSGIRTSLGERQLSDADDGNVWSSHGSPMMMAVNGGGHPPYAFHRPSDHSQYSTMPPQSISTSASTSTPSSPYMYTPSTASRYQPYPVHSSNNFHTYPGVAMSTSSQSAGPSYSSVKRARSHSRPQVEEYGAPLDRSMMSEQEYFTKLYYYTVEQQKIINDEIRRYGRQRTQFAQLPVELQRQMMTQMGGLRGAADMQALLSMPPPSYDRGDSASGAFGGMSGPSGSPAMPASPASLPPFLPDILDSNMDESNYGRDEHAQPANFQPWDFSDHMH